MSAPIHSLDAVLAFLRRRKFGSLVFALALLCIALFGVYLLSRATPYGLGLVNDSAAYVGGAANLLAGNGYTRTSGGGELKPITHFPPLFSMLLAGISFTGLDLLQSARLLIQVFFALAILLTGSLVHWLTRSAPLALFAAFLLACSDTTLGVYAYLMSEPLFIVLMLAALLSFGCFYAGRYARWLVLCGALIGLAYLTRFAALSLLVALLATLFLLARPGPRFWADFFRPAAALLAGALPFLLGWSFFNLLITGEVGNRQLLLHPLPATALFGGLKNLFTWLAPQELLALHPIFGWVFSGLSLILPLILLLALIWVWAATPQGVSPALALFAALALHILAYLVFLVLSISLFDATTPLDDRILTIIYIPELILFACLPMLIRFKSHPTVASQPIPRENSLGIDLAVSPPNQSPNSEKREGKTVSPHPGARSGPSRTKWAIVLQWLVVAACLALAVFSLRDGLAAVAYLSRDGLGFNHSGWRGSPAIAQVRTMPPLLLYSNRPTAIFLLTGKSAYVIPTPTDAVTTLTRPEYGADLTEMQTRIRLGQAALILFDMKTDPEEADLYADLTDQLPLLADYGNAQIFAASP